MKSELLQFPFYVMVLVLGGASEEILPKFCGVGFPVLLAAVVEVASHRPLPVLMLFALAAGAFEDALSSLPAMTSVCWYLAVALLVWRIRFHGIVAIVSYALYQIWVGLVVPAGGGVTFARLAMALLLATVSVFAVGGLIAWIERKAALDVA